jgi:antitoxin YefM
MDRGSNLVYIELSYIERRVCVLTTTEIQYISDAEGNPTGVIVPIDLWREIESERETAYLLNSENMKRRLLESKDRSEGITFGEALAKLGV